MARIRVWVDLSDERFGLYEAEAERRGVSVESLVEQTVNCLLADLESEQADDHPIFPC